MPLEPHAPGANERIVIATRQGPPPFAPGRDDVRRVLQISCRIVERAVLRPAHVLRDLGIAAVRVDRVRVLRAQRAQAQARRVQDGYRDHRHARSMSWMAASGSIRSPRQYSASGSSTGTTSSSLTTIPPLSLRTTTQSTVSLASRF